MNEKIKELAEQATRIEEPDGLFPREVFDQEKFAELIVRECAELCLNNETFQGMFHSMEYRKGRHFNTIIKEHFGIEQ